MLKRPRSEQTPDVEKSFLEIKNIIIQSNKDAQNKLIAKNKLLYMHEIELEELQGIMNSYTKIKKSHESIMKFALHNDTPTDGPIAYLHSYKYKNISKAVEQSKYIQNKIFTSQLMEELNYRINLLNSTISCLKSDIEFLKIQIQLGKQKTDSVESLPDTVLPN